jgi:hypothetical protein
MNHMTDQDWTVPLRYTRTEIADFIEAVKAGRHGRLVFAQRSEGGDTYAIAKSSGARNLWFNRLRVVDDPQYARDLAEILLAWADRKENEAP